MHLFDSFKDTDIAECKRGSHFLWCGKTVANVPLTLGWVDYGPSEPITPAEMVGKKNKCLLAASDLF